MTVKSKNSISDRVLTAFFLLFFWAMYAMALIDIFAVMPIGMHKDRDFVSNHPLGWTGEILALSAPIAGVVLWKCLRRWKWFFRLPLALGVFILFFFLGTILFEITVDMAPTSKFLSNCEDPRVRLQEKMGVTLPENAANIKCKTQALTVMWVFARFDIPAEDLPDLLSSYPFSKLPPLMDNSELTPKPVPEDAAWWSVSVNHADLKWSQISWRPEDKQNYVCEFSLFVMRNKGTATVYIQYSEDAASDMPVTGDNAPPLSECLVECVNPPEADSRTDDRE